MVQIYEDKLDGKISEEFWDRKNGEHRDQAESVLLNCSTDGISLCLVYRKPFDLIFQRAKKEDWSGRADLNCRPLAPQASALPG